MIQNRTLCKHINIAYEDTINRNGNFTCSRCNTDILELIHWPNRQNMYFTYKELYRNLWFLWGVSYYNFGTQWLSEEKYNYYRIRSKIYEAKSYYRNKSEIYKTYEIDNKNHIRPIKEIDRIYK